MMFDNDDIAGGKTGAQLQLREAFGAGGEWTRDSNAIDLAGLYAGGCETLLECLLGETAAANLARHFGLLNGGGDLAFADDAASRIAEQTAQAKNGSRQARPFRDEPESCSFSVQSDQKLRGLESVA